MFHFLRHSTVFVTSLLIVTFIASTVPYRHVEARSVHCTNCYTERTGNMALAAQRSSALSNSTAAANTGVSATMNTAMFNQSSVLDGIAWSIAKQMVSQMTRSLIEWVNSGFQGSPAFVTDLEGMLIDVLDQTAGEYIKSLGGIGEFICSPFRLDVQVALNVAYEKARGAMPSGPSEDMCTLTDIKNNIEGFLDGNVSSWDQWLKVTSNPQNTPYGAYLAAEAKLNLRLTNAAGQTLTEVNWGEGFLAMKDCKNVDGSTQQKCTVTTPGKVISDALSFNLESGTRSLIEADEINELIGALFNQLVLQAVKGLNSLTTPNYGGRSGSYLDQTVDSTTPPINLTPYKAELDAAYETEVDYLTLINKASGIASAQIASSTGASTTVLQNLLLETGEERTKVNNNLAQLSIFRSRYDQASTTAAAEAADTTSTSTPRTAHQIQQEVILDYINFKSFGTLTTDIYIEEQRDVWQKILYPDDEDTL